MYEVVTGSSDMVVSVTVLLLTLFNFLQQGMLTTLFFSECVCTTLILIFRYLLPAAVGVFGLKTNLRSLPPCQISLWSVQHVASVGSKNQKISPEWKQYRQSCGFAVKTSKMECWDAYNNAAMLLCIFCHFCFGLTRFSSYLVLYIPKSYYHKRNFNVTPGTRGTVNPYFFECKIPYPHIISRLSKTKYLSKTVQVYNKLILVIFA